MQIENGTYFIYNRLYTRNKGVIREVKKSIISLISILLICLNISSYSYAYSYVDPFLVKKANSIQVQKLNMRESIFRLTDINGEEKAEKIPVLLYHHLLKEEDIAIYGWQNNSSILSVESFNSQMDYLYKNGYYTATLNELEEFLKGNIQLPKKTVVITFDDGYLSNGVYAYPVLKEYGFRASIFMRGIYSQGPQKSFDPSTSQVIALRELHKYQDVFEYGCHGYDLHELDEFGIPLIKSLPRDLVIKDLQKNKSLFNTNYIAYPFGGYDEYSLSYMDELGYKLGFTVEKGYVDRSLSKYELPRFIISPYTSMASFQKILNID